MKVLDVCKNYFNGFQEVSNFRNNDSTTNVLAALKTLSYFTVVIPLGFAIAYGAASLYGRVSKKQNLSSHDKSVNNKAKTTLLKKHYTHNISSTVSSNHDLAQKIIAAKGKDDKDLQSICSGDFLIDPTAHLVSKMIKRGVGGARKDDPARSFIVSQIPDFIEKVSSPDYLRTFAEKYFENHLNKTEIMQFFEGSLANEEFQRDLKTAVEQWGEDSFQAEGALRTPLTIFDQSAQLKEYSYPKAASRE